MTGEGVRHPQIREGDQATSRQRRAHRVAAVREARVVAATLIGAGGDLRDLLEAGQLFDVVVIDEVGRPPAVIGNFPYRGGQAI